MKALVGTFNQEKALVGAFSVIVQPVVEHYTALTLTLAGAEDLLDGELAGPPRHVEGAALQLAALLARHPQAPAREPGERTPAETVGK